MATIGAVCDINIVKKKEGSWMKMDRWMDG